MLHNNGTYYVGCNSGGFKVYKSDDPFQQGGGWTHVTTMVFPPEWGSDAPGELKNEGGGGEAVRLCLAVSEAVLGCAWLWVAMLGCAWLCVVVVVHTGHALAACPSQPQLLPSSEIWFTDTSGPCSLPLFPLPLRCALRALLRALLSCPPTTARAARLRVQTRTCGWTAAAPGT